ncbi:thymidylate synthase [Aestuariimicrobium sp. Y1814]|uniref:thymidylate synthase n=1 Tax=Aestuariimicrobium sp. Y1814 TaxID=3418742 RepID=UPI003DA76301
MRSIALRGESANTLFRDAWESLKSEPSLRASRDKGASAEALHVTFSLENPRQRWISARTPPINPAFALAETVWILDGRNDLAFLSPWNTTYSNFVGPSAAVYGAYGERLRSRFGIDQLEQTYRALTSTPESRQAVLSIWDPRSDLPGRDGQSRSRDIPCNITSLLKVSDNRLYWTQVMRSNDLIRGLPYNFVQWTTIQEVFAGWLGLEVGEYFHLSDSLHIYDTDRPRFSYKRASEFINDDDLRLPFEDSRGVITNLAIAITTLSLANNFEEIVAAEDLFTGPRAYRNWLRVMAAERARRLNLDPTTWIEGISNTMLKTVIQNWVEFYGGSNG